MAILKQVLHILTPCILMDFSIKINTIKTGLSIVFIVSSQKEESINTKGFNVLVYYLKELNTIEPCKIIFSSSSWCKQFPCVRLPSAIIALSTP